MRSETLTSRRARQFFAVCANLTLILAGTFFAMYVAASASPGLNKALDQSIVADAIGIVLTLVGVHATLALVIGMASYCLRFDVKRKVLWVVAMYCLWPFGVLAFYFSVYMPNTDELGHNGTTPRSRMSPKVLSRRNWRRMLGVASAMFVISFVVFALDIRYAINKMSPQELARRGDTDWILGRWSVQCVYTWMLSFVLAAISIVGWMLSPPDDATLAKPASERTLHRGPP